MAASFSSHSMIPPNRDSLKKIKYSLPFPFFLPSCHPLPTFCHLSALLRASQSSPLDSFTCLSALCSPDHWIVHNNQGARSSTCVCDVGCSLHIAYTLIMTRKHTSRKKEGSFVFAKMNFAGEVLLLLFLTFE